MDVALMHDRVSGPLADLARNARRDLRWRIGMTIAALYAVSAAAYLGWRLTVFNSDAPLFSTFFYLSEFYSMLVSFIVVLISWKSTQRHSLPPPQGLTVDVFVTTYNEPLDVVRRTLLACTRMDYPHQTWLLDDGNRAEMHALARELGCRYLAREKNVDAKAGNLNNALAHSRAEFVALFDADNVPRRDFLDRLLGYFSDPRLAYVQTPQDFYNVNSFQHAPGDNGRLIWNEQSYFHYPKQQGCDGWNAAVLCGSSAVLRRRALDDVGGFATETVTEDIHTGIRMMKNGWRAAYHPVPLAFGIAPTDIDAYLRQRLRWGLGNLQTCREEGLPFSRGLTWPQRICYLSLTIQFLDGWQKFIFYLAPAAVLILGIPPFLSDIGVFCSLFIPFVLLQSLLYLALSRGYVRPLAIEMFSMARFATYCISTLGLFRKRVRFGVSSKDLVGRVNLLQLAPTFAVFLLNGIGLGFFGLRLAGDGNTGLTTDVALIVCFWAFLLMAFAIGVVRAAIRAGRNREHNFSFRLPLPVELKSTFGTIAAATTRISLDRMTLTLPRQSRPRRESALAGTLHFPGETVSFAADVEREQHDGDMTTLECRFRLPAVEHDRLDLALHASTWYRPIIGQSEAAPNVIDWLIRRLTRAERPSRLHWQPMLWRPVSPQPGCWYGGYVARDDAGAALLFQRLAGHTVVDICPAGVALKSGDPQCVLLSPAGPESDEAFAEEGVVSQCKAEEISPQALLERTASAPDVPAKSLPVVQTRTRAGPLST